ncbi:hypothetical protein MTP04_22430 [Lysinibacillus sp. PLM2]|nr:hypothetical protein MTP04_22430 [Lysinibacillus sp. PLM2]
MAIKGAINTSKLAEEINKALLTYTNEVVERVDTLAEFLAKEGVKKLKLTSPKSSGAYARSWKASKIGRSWVIHNVKHYRLTHLLEKGHAKVSGGRTQAYPHIAPVEKELVDEYVKGVEEAIKG